MKSKLIQRQILGLNHAWKRNRRGHLSAVSAAGVLLLLNLSGSAVIAQGVDACAQTSDDALAACRGGSAER